MSGISWRHEVALGFVCRGSFWCDRHCKTSLVSSFTENRPKTDPNISGQIAFRYPDSHRIFVGGKFWHPSALRHAVAAGQPVAAVRWRVKYFTGAFEK